MDIDALLEREGIYQTHIDEYSFSWRLLTLKEYHVFRRLLEGGVLLPFVVYSKVFDRCFLGHAGAISHELPAGIFISIGEYIMHLSGGQMYSDIKESILEARDAYAFSSVEEYMKRIIMIAFSTYTPDTFKNWTSVELLRQFTIAEYVLKNKNPEYQLMDVKQINRPDAPVNSGIDFQADNQMLAQALGPNEKASWEDRIGEKELARRKEIARKMDREKNPGPKTRGKK